MKSDHPASDSFAELEKQLERCRQKHRSEQPCARLHARIRQECTRDLHCKRRMPRGARFAWSIIFIGVGIALFGGRHGLQNVSRAFVVGIAAWSVVLGLVLFAGLGSAPGTRPTRPLRFALVVGLPALFLLGLAALATHILSASEFFGRGGLTGALPCSLHAFVSGALISGAILLLWRRTDPFTPGLTGALVGLVGGLAGAIAVSLACPSTEGWHLWLGHGFAILGVVLLGWIAGRRWLSP